LFFVLLFIYYLFIIILKILIYVFKKFIIILYDINKTEIGIIQNFLIYFQIIRNNR